MKIQESTKNINNFQEIQEYQENQENQENPPTSRKIKELNSWIVH